MLSMCVVWQKQTLMDVMSRKTVLDALAGYHPFWLSAALEVISSAGSVAVMLVLITPKHIRAGVQRTHHFPAEASALTA